MRFCLSPRILSSPAMIRSTSSALLLSTLFTAAGLGLAPRANAQWATDPALNNAVGDSTSDQNLSKLAPTPDGGVWISWFDGIGSGYDVRIQKLDAAGNEVFAHNGLLVADRTFSSTQDYGLDTDVNGDALLTFRDTRQGGTQITAAKVTAAGAQPWGVTGVQLTNTTTFVASPKIAGTSDGGAVVAWTEGSSSKVQKLDSAGAPQWAMPVTLTPGAGSYSVSDLHDSGNDAILSIVHQTGGFGSPRLILAQKYDSTGAPLWTASPVTVLGAGSLQFGNFPSFRADGSGGAVFSWYTSSPSLQVFLQRVDAAGSVVHAANGIPVSNAAGQLRTDPSLALDPASGDAYVFWRETNGAQSMWGVSGQRIDLAGTLVWGATGTTIVPVGSVETGLVTTVQGGASGGALVCWKEAPSFNTDQLFGAHVAAGGSVDVAKFQVASTPSGKMRMSGARSAAGAGFGIFSWSDARTDGGDIYAQAVRFDGTLGGGSTGTNYCFGDGGDQMGCTNCPCSNNAAPGTIGGCLNSASTSAELVATGAASVSGDTLRFEVERATPVTFGVLVSANNMLPNAGACPVGSGIQAFDGLRCVGGGLLRHGTRPSDANGDIGVTGAGWGPPNGPAGGLIASGGFSAGQTRNFQCFYRENVLLGCATGQNTTNATSITFAP